MRPILVVDTETTGLNVKTAEIIEIAVCDVETETMESFLLRPVEGIPENVQKLTGIDEEMVKDQPTFFEKIEDVIKLLRPGDNPIYVAHHAPYDMPVIRNNLDFAGLTEKDTEWLSRENWLCTNRLLRRAHGHKPRLKYTNLPAAIEFFNLDVPEADTVHRAEADVWMALRLFNQLRKNDYEDLSDEELIDLCWQRYVFARFPFGKHKGKLLKDIPTGYFVWMCDNMDSLNPKDERFDPDLYSTIEKEIERRVADLGD